MKMYKHFSLAQQVSGDVASSALFCPGELPCFCTILDYWCVLQGTDYALCILLHPREALRKLTSAIQRYPLH